MTRASDELKRLRSLISDLDAIVWEAEPETLRYTFVSDRAEDILGYRPKDWIATPEFWGDHIHPDDRAATIAFSRAAVARGDDYDVEYRFLGSDGSTIWIRDLVHVVHDERGHPAWLRGLMVDVTDQKMTELRLHEAEEKYRTLVERLPAVVYSETGNAAINTVSYISPQVERTLSSGGASCIPTIAHGWRSRTSGRRNRERRSSRSTVRSRAPERRCGSVTRRCRSWTAAERSSPGKEFCWTSRRPSARSNSWPERSAGTRHWWSSRRS
jgi:PAS domain S-box-containing protein